MKNRYELRDVQAIYYDDGWCWNDSFHLSEFEVTADPHFSFKVAIDNEGFTIDWQKVYIYDDWDVLELRDIETDEPYFAAIPL